MFVWFFFFFFFSSRRRHTRLTCDWSSDVCSSDLADNKRFNAGQRRSGRSQSPDVLGNALSLISLKRFQIKAVFVAKRVVHALPADIHCTQQIVRRSCSIALSPENGHRPCYGCITIKFPWPCHGL